MHILCGGMIHHLVKFVHILVTQVELLHRMDGSVCLSHFRFCIPYSNIPVYHRLILGLLSCPDITFVPVEDRYAEADSYAKVVVSDITVLIPFSG